MVVSFLSNVHHSVLSFIGCQAPATRTRNAILYLDGVFFSKSLAVGEETHQRGSGQDNVMSHCD